MPEVKNAAPPIGRHFHPSSTDTSLTCIGDTSTPSQQQTLPTLQQQSLPSPDPINACDENMDHDSKGSFPRREKTVKKNEVLVSQDYLSFITFDVHFL